MSDKYKEETMKSTCCCCPPHDCKVPVVVERIIKPYFNPDGSPSGRNYYLYPVTTLSAVHQTTDIFSPTLEDIFQRINEKIQSKQKMIAGGSKDVILTRGRDDGEVGELNKIDYIDLSRRSKIHIPSEYAVLKTIDQAMADAKILVGQETTRATAAEETITDMVRDESNRAKGVETELDNAIVELNKKAVMKSDLEDGMFVRDIIIDASDISNITWKKTRTNIITGSTDTVKGAITTLDDNVNSLIDIKLNAAEKENATVKQSIFDNVGGKTTANVEFVPGNGNLIGRLNVTKKPVNGIGEDTLDIVGFRSDAIVCDIRDIMSNEKEITFSLAYNDDEDITEAFTAIFA